MPVAAAVLQRLALLHGLPTEALDTLGKYMSLHTFARRAVVLNRGEEGHGLGFLLEGRLQGVDFTLDGREVGLYFVAAGDYFGELSVVDDGPAPEFVMALGRAQVAFLPREAARGLVLSTPSIAEKVMKRLSARVRSASAQRTLLSLPNPVQRLCAQLLVLVREEASRIDNAPTHQELAIMINTSRETVTRAFQVLQSQHILLRDGTTLVVQRSDALADIADGKAELTKPKPAEGA